jgi:protein transport protein SEC24
VYYTLLLEDHIDVLAKEVVNTFRMHTACDVILKLRTSIGIQVDSYLGNGRNSGHHSEVEVAVASTQFTCAFGFLYDAILKDNDPVYFQFAVLYTAPNGVRKVRVHNLALKASALAHAVFRNADLDCVTAYMFKVACSKVTHETILLLFMYHLFIHMYATGIAVASEPSNRRAARVSLSDADSYPTFLSNHHRHDLSQSTTHIA